MHLRSYSLWHLLALFAWAAQLLLPVVHAASMAPAVGANSPWCGESSPALQQQRAELPRELQSAGAPASQAEQLEHCLQCCAGLSAPANVLPQPPALLLRQAELGPAHAPSPRAVPASRHAPLPPARGPPSLI